MAVNAIADNDPELVAQLRLCKRSVYSLPQMVEDGPFSLRKLQYEIQAGNLKTYYSDRHRLADAIEWARFIVSLRRRAASAEAEQQRRDRARQIGTSDKAREGHRRARQTRAAKKAAAQEAATAA